MMNWGVAHSRAWLGELGGGPGRVSRRTWGRGLEDAREKRAPRDLEEKERLRPWGGWPRATHGTIRLAGGLPHRLPVPSPGGGGQGSEGAGPHAEAASGARGGPGRPGPWQRPAWLHEAPAGGGGGGGRASEGRQGPRPARPEVPPGPGPRACPRPQPASNPACGLGPGPCLHPGLGPAAHPCASPRPRGDPGPSSWARCSPAGARVGSGLEKDRSSEPQWGEEPEGTVGATPESVGIRARPQGPRIPSRLSSRRRARLPLLCPLHVPCLSRLSISHAEAPSSSPTLLLFLTRLDAPHLCLAPPGHSQTPVTSQSLPRVPPMTPLTRLPPRPTSSRGPGRGWAAGCALGPALSSAGRSWRSAASSKCVRPGRRGLRSTSP